MLEPRKNTRLGWAWKSKKYRTWRLDFEAIRDEMDERELKWPVMIGVSHGGGRSTTFGTHRVKIGRFGPYHQITLLRHADTETASKTMHHELTHAEQAELIGTDFYLTAYREERQQVGYAQSRFEQEANAAMARHHDRPLAHER